MNTTETKTPYGSIFRSGDREWFPGSVEEFRTAKAWEENQKNKVTPAAPAAPAAPQVSLNGAAIIAWGPDAIYVRIPEPLQVAIAGGCDCGACKTSGKPPMWDTLGVPTDRGEAKSEPRYRTQTAFTVHMPDPVRSQKYWDAKLAE